MSAGCDAAVERAARAGWEHWQTRMKMPPELLPTFDELSERLKDIQRGDARAALAAAVGGGCILSAEDVADLWTVIRAAERWRFIGDDEASNDQDDAARDALNRLRALLGSREGAT